LRFLRNCIALKELTVVQVRAGGLHTVSDICMEQDFPGSRGNHKLTRPFRFSQVTSRRKASLLARQANAKDGKFSPPGVGPKL
jgi:hypothetical protein